MELIRNYCSCVTGRQETLLSSQVSLSCLQALAGAGAECQLRAANVKDIGSPHFLLPHTGSVEEGQTQREGFTACAAGELCAQSRGSQPRPAATWKRRCVWAAEATPEPFSPPGHLPAPLYPRGSRPDGCHGNWVTGEGQAPASSLVGHSDLRLQPGKDRAPFR